MSYFNLTAFIVTVIVSFILSAVYYTLLAEQRAGVSPAARKSGGRPTPT